PSRRRCSVSLRAVVPLVTVAAYAVAWAVHSPAQPAEPVAAPRPAQPAGRIVGVVGCAAAGCHNAGGLSPALAGSEYGLWTRDPHGRAFATLGSPRYRNILARLKTTAYTEELCLKCHVTPTPDGSPLPHDLLSDGVGCESCHGPAEKWRTEHYAAAWKGLSADERWAKYGFYPTKDLGKRAERCAECHVGTTD